MFPFRYLIPQQFEPVSAPTVNGDGEQCLTDEIEQGADRVDRQQNAENSQNRQRLLEETLQIEQSCPEQLLGSGIVGDQIHGERGLRYPVDDAAMEGDPVEQQEHAETNHDDRQLPIPGDEDIHIVPEHGRHDGNPGIQQEKSKTNADHQPDLPGGKRLHIPLIGGNQNEQIDEGECAGEGRTYVRRGVQGPGHETSQTPDDECDRGQRQVVFAAECPQSLGQEGKQRQEDGVGGGVPPQARAQRQHAFQHDSRGEIGAVEHEVGRYEQEAPEQEFAFHDPHAPEIGLDGLLLVEEEPCGDGEEDDDADLAAAGHDELEEDPLRSQRKLFDVIAVVDDEVVHEDHEHRNNAQQLNAGIPFLILCASGPCRRAVPDVCATTARALDVFIRHCAPSLNSFSSA